MTWESDERSHCSPMPSFPVPSSGIVHPYHDHAVWTNTDDQRGELLDSRRTWRRPDTLTRHHRPGGIDIAMTHLSQHEQGWDAVSTRTVTRGSRLMKFWCSTVFMSSGELPAVATMLDDAGYHGAMVSRPPLYPRS